MSAPVNNIERTCSRERIGARRRRGFARIDRGSAGSSASAIAGNESVTRLSQRICNGKRGRWQPRDPDEQEQHHLGNVGTEQKDDRLLEMLP